MVCVSASVNLPLHHKVQKFSSGTGSPGSSQKKGRKTVVVVISKSSESTKREIMSIILIIDCLLKIPNFGQTV